MSDETRWRWEEKDYGLRYREGRGKKVRHLYEATRPGELYVVAPEHQKRLTAARIDELARPMEPGHVPVVVPNPWSDYDQHDDFVMSTDGICLNLAGCLERAEVERQETLGVARAQEYVNTLVERSAPVPLSVKLMLKLHRSLFDEVYPFAGKYRTAPMTKGEGPIKWPMPHDGIEPRMKEMERGLFARTPFLSDDNQAVYLWAAKVMCHVLVIHPFREGNGRMAALLANLILMQNDLNPIGMYDRHRDEKRYFDACEAGRKRGDLAPLAALIGEWEQWDVSEGAAP